MSHDHHADDWHHHSSDEGLPQTEHAATVNPRTLMITFIGIVFGVLFLILLILVYFENYTTRAKAQKTEGVPSVRSEYVAARGSAESRLSNFGHIDRESGTVHVPLEVAIDRVVADYAASGSSAADSSEEGDLADGG